MKVGIYTGFTENEIDWSWGIFQFVDWLKIGEYKEELKSTNSKLASSNQTFLFLTKH